MKGYCLLIIQNYHSFLSHPIRTLSEERKKRTAQKIVLVKEKLIQIGKILKQEKDFARKKRLVVPKIKVFQDLYGQAWLNLLRGKLRRAGRIADRLFQMALAIKHDLLLLDRMKRQGGLGEIS